MYEVSFRVRFSDIGDNNKLRLYELPKRFQDASIEHSESLGVGIPYLVPRNLAWLLTSWQIDINRLPSYNEQLIIRTWPYDFKGAFGYRNYDMFTQEGEVLAQAYAIWLHTDVAQMQPAKTSEEEVSRYGFEPRLDMEYTPRKISLPNELQEVDRLKVQSHYVDMYHHLNNAIYVDIASDYLPSQVDVKRIRVDYRKQMQIGDIMVIKQTWEEEKCYVAFCDENGDMHVSTEFTIRKE